METQLKIRVEGQMLPQPSEVISSLAKKIMNRYIKKKLEKVRLIVKL